MTSNSQGLRIYYVDKHRSSRTTSPVQLPSSLSERKLQKQLSKQIISPAFLTAPTSLRDLTIKQQVIQTKPFEPTSSLEQPRSQAPFQANQYPDVSVNVNTEYKGNVGLISILNSLKQQPNTYSQEQQKIQSISRTTLHTQESKLAESDTILETEDKSDSPKGQGFKTCFQQSLINSRKFEEETRMSEGTLTAEQLLFSKCNIRLRTDSLSEVGPTRNNTQLDEDVQAIADLTLINADKVLALANSHQIHHIQDDECSLSFGQEFSQSIISVSQIIRNEDPMGEQFMISASEHLQRAIQVSKTLTDQIHKQNLQSKTTSQIIENMAKTVLGLESKVRYYEHTILQQSQLMRMLEDQLSTEKNRSKSLKINMLNLKGNLYTVNQIVLGAFGESYHGLKNEFKGDYEEMVETERRLDRLYNEVQNFRVSNDRDYQVMSALNSQIQEETEYLDSFIKGVQDKSSQTLTNITKYIQQKERVEQDHLRLTEKFDNSQQVFETQLTHKECIIVELEKQLDRAHQQLESSAKEYLQELESAQEIVQHSHKELVELKLNVDALRVSEAQHKMKFTQLYQQLNRKQATLKDASVETDSTNTDFLKIQAAQKTDTQIQILDRIEKLALCDVAIETIRIVSVEENTEVEQTKQPTQLSTASKTDQQDKELQQARLVQKPAVVNKVALWDSMVKCLALVLLYLFASNSI